MKRTRAAIAPAINKRLQEVCLIKRKEYPEDPNDVENLAQNLHKFDIYHIYEIGNTGATISEKAKSKPPPPAPKSTTKRKQQQENSLSNIADGVPRPCKGRSYDYTKFMTSNKQYKCPFKNCQKLFSKPTYFREHLFVHDKDRPFKCDGCKKTFALNKYRMRHSRDYCSKSKLYKGSKKSKNMPNEISGNESRQTNDDDDSMIENDGYDDGGDQTMGSLWDNSDNMHDLLAQQQQLYYQDQDNNENGDHNDNGNNHETNDDDDDVDEDNDNYDQNGTVNDDGAAVPDDSEIEFVNPFDFL